ncbi:MAG: peptidyl-prolyl cis-trans isomerase [Flavobacteriaceae bacterium]
MKKFTVHILIFFLFGSCDLSVRNSDIDAIARVNNVYLTIDDVDQSLFYGLDKKDSLFQIQNVINDWATKVLLEDGALVNINIKKQEEFERLIQQYRSDLYTSAYLEGLVKNNLDTIILDYQYEEIYKQIKELFVLKEDLIKLRYVNHDKSMPNANDIKRRFKRYNFEDQAILDTISIQFNSFFLNDSVWIKSEDVLKKINPLTKGFNKVLLKKLNFIQLKDSLGLYLIQVNDIIEAGDQAPISYALPTIKQIILNRRKLKLVNQLKSEIVNDAIKNKKFEIYN